jgi:hypothetical protein
VIALITIAAALVLAVALGFAYAAAEHIPAWHGVYCTWMTAVTVGGDVNPVNGTGYIILAIDGVLVIPLVAATFSLLTSALSGTHIAAAEKRIKDHTEARLRHHLKGAGCEPQD